MIITYTQMRTELAENINLDLLRRFDRIFNSDAAYFVASTEFFETELFPWYKLQLKHYRVWDYELSWDCDKFATAFQVFANISHAQPEPKLTEAIAVGVVHYLPDNSIEGMHAINCVFVCNKDGVITLKFIEPQHPAFVELSATEQRSINFMKW